MPIGTYTVTEEVPGGYVATTPAQVAAVVTADATTELRFGNRIIPGALEAFVFVDVDGSGVQDPGDLPYPGAAVAFVSPCGDDAGAVTDGAGTILWPDRCVGAYAVNLTVPAGYVATTPVSVNTDRHLQRDQSRRLWHPGAGDTGCGQVRGPQWRRATRIPAKGHWTA